MPTTKGPTRSKASKQVVFPDLNTLEQLLDIGQSLTTVRDLSALLKRVAKAAGSILNADAVVLYEYQADTDDVIIPPTVWGKLRQPRVLKEKGRARAHRDSLVFQVLRRSQPIYATDAAADWAKVLGTKAKRTGESDGFVQREGIASSAAVRLTVHQNTVGVIFVNYRTPHTFGEEEKRIIELFATQAATAIQNTRLFQLEQEQRQRAKTLQEVARIVNSAQSLNEVVNLILGQLGKVIEYNSASVQLIQGDRRILVGGQGFKPPKPDPRLHRNVSEDPLVSEIIQQRQPMVLSEVTTDLRWQTLPETEHVKSWMGVPLIARDQVIGLLTLDHRKAGYYTRESGELVAAFANQVATAIYNSIQTQALTELTQLAQQFISIRESRRDTNDLLKQVAQSALEVLKADVVDFYEYRQETRQFVVPPVMSGKRYRPAAPKTEIREDDVIIQLARKNEACYILDVQTDEFFSHPFSPDRPETWPAERFAVREGIKSTAFVPLKAGSEIVGYMFVSYRTPQLFALEQRNLIELFASQAATAVNNSHLVADLQLQIGRLQILNQVGRELSSRLDAEAIYGAVAEAVVQTLDCTHCTIFALEDNQLVPHASHGKGKGPTVTRRFALGKGLVGQVAQDAKPLLVRDASTHKNFVAGQTRPHVERSLIVVPVKAGDKVVSVISADQDRINAFDERDLQMVETLALQAGAAFQNARLFDEAQRRIRDLEIVNTVAQDISARLDTWDLFETIVSRIAAQLNCTHCTLFLLQEQDGEPWLIPQRTHGVRPEIMTRRFRASEGLVGWVFQHGESLVLPDVRQDPRFAPARDAKEMPRSMLVSPVRIGAQTIGVISADQDQFNWFSENDRRLVDTLAKQAAIAIENARLFRQSTHQVAELKALYEVGKEVTASLNWEQTLQLIAEKTRDLTESERSLVVVVHEGSEKVTAKGHGYAAEYLAGFTFQELRDGVSGWVLDHNEPALIPDVLADERCVGIAKTAATQFNSKSLVIAPLRVRNTVIGTLTAVNTREGRLFTQETLETVIRLADQASIAIANAQLYEELRDRATQLVQLEEITVKVLAESGTSTSVLSLIATRVAGIFGAYSCTIRPYDRQLDQFGAPIASEGSEDRQTSFPARPDGASRHILNTKQPIYAEDPFAKLPNGQLVIRPENRERGVNAVAYLPLLSSDEVVGRIAVLWNASRHFSENDRRMLDLFAGQAAAGVKIAQLYKQLTEANGQLVERNQELAQANQQLDYLVNRKIRDLQAVYKVSQQLTSAVRMNEQDILALIHEQIKPLMDAKNMYIALYNEVTDTVRFPLMYEDGQSVQMPSRQGGAGRTEWIIRTRKSILIETRAESEAWYKEPERKEYRGEPYASWVGVPMMAGDKVLGVIATYHKTRDYVYDKDHLEVLSLMASQVAIVLQNTRMWEAMQKLSEDLSAGALPDVE